MSTKPNSAKECPPEFIPGTGTPNETQLNFRPNTVIGHLFGDIIMLENLVRSIDQYCHQRFSTEIHEVLFEHLRHAVGIMDNIFDEESDEDIDDDIDLICREEFPLTPTNSVVGANIIPPNSINTRINGPTTTAPVRPAIQSGPRITPTGQRLPPNLETKSNKP